MRRGGGILACWLAGVLTCAGGAVAQVSYDDLQQIEDGTADLGPLGTSSMVMPLQLQQPNDFSSIFQLPGRDGSSQFVRFAGGTAAVFPRSVYLPTPEGYLPDIPPGTIFYVDGLPQDLYGPVSEPSRPASPYQVSYRYETGVSTRVSSRPGSVPSDEMALSGRAGPPSIWSGEEHRRHRVTQLVRRAVEAEQSGDQLP